MINTQKIFGGIVVVAAVLGALAFFGFTPYGKQVVQQFGTSTQGSTGQTAKQYSVLGVNLVAPGANATSSSIQNNTGDDLYVTGLKVGCEGVGTSKTAYTGTGLALLTLSVGTSSTASPAVAPTNLIMSAVTIATSTVDFTLASSTAATPGNSTYLNIWNAGSYMTFATNATNTAVCTYGVDVTSS